jgi:hypothetical protein
MTLATELALLQRQAGTYGEIFGWSVNLCKISMTCGDTMTVSNHGLLRTEAAKQLGNSNI